MPMTFDTYSRCSYRCSYCFALNQKEIGHSKVGFHAAVRCVDTKAIVRRFRNPRGQFGEYIRQRRVMQWGGMADQFDEFERKHGKTLELLRFFRRIQYPLCFSTKATWWAYDQRYRDAFQGADYFNVKFSIITTDEEKAHVVETGCPTPQARLTAMREAAKFVGGGVTLRLRPFIIGLSDVGLEDLIAQAASAGAGAVSTEFFCLEMRAVTGKERYGRISSAVGFDIVDYYKARSAGAGYMRLNREVKRPYVDRMEKACRKHGLRFYVSDMDFKERCDNGSCCGLPESWNYSRGQFTHALVIARERGEVSWSDISKDAGELLTAKYQLAEGFNASSCERRARFNDQALADVMHYTWNHPNETKSPYMCFGGVLCPERVDENGDVVYRYDRELAEGKRKLTKVAKAGARKKAR